MPMKLAPRRVLKPFKANSTSENLDAPDKAILRPTMMQIIDHVSMRVPGRFSPQVGMIGRQLGMFM
jgi:hypothetical protein